MAQFIRTQEISNESEDQIKNRLFERFDILESLTTACLNGSTRSLIVSGPPGLGKSYTVEQKLAEWDPNEINYTVIKGYVRPTGLFKILHKYREAGQVVVFDDADTIFYDDTSLNILKSVCDTTERRKVCWLSEKNLEDDESGDSLPKSFVFNGSIIFITNLDFDDLIERGHKLTPHLEALVSRSQYIDLGMKSKRDYIVRIRQVIEQGLLSDLDQEGKTEVVDFIVNNANKLRELSLRMAIKIGCIRKSSPHNWTKVAMVTCCRT
jgi:hypothetical protein